MEMLGDAFGLKEMEVLSVGAGENKLHMLTSGVCELRDAWCPPSALK